MNTDSILKYLLESLKQKLIELRNLLTKQQTSTMPPDQYLPPPIEPTPLPTSHSKIRTWARAIEAQESTSPPKPSDRNARNKNPGNLRFSPYTKSLGAIGRDAANFCIFPSYAIGFDALCTFLTAACRNQLIPYHDKTLIQFTKIYAQPPNNNYAINVAKALGVSLTTPIKDLL